MAALNHLQLSAQGFLFDHKTGVSYSTNRVGSFILKALIDGQDRETILADLLDSFQVEQDRAVQDFEEFAGLLRSFRLLPGSSRLAASA